MRKCAKDRFLLRQVLGCQNISLYELIALDFRSELAIMTALIQLDLTNEN